jgi:DUF2939 family protein
VSGTNSALIPRWYPERLDRGTWMKIAIGSLILTALGWITWPYYALYDFANGMQQGDQVALERRVAWEEVRRGLRDDLNAVLLQRLSKNDGAPIGTALVALIGPTIINNAIDSYVTPQGIAGIIRNGKASIPSEAQIENSAPDRSVSTPDDKQKGLLQQWKQVRYAFFSSGPLTFRVDIASDNAPSGQGPVTLLFKWAGDWKLSRIFLPVDAIQNTQVKADNPTRQETQEEIQSRRDVEARATNEWTTRELRKDPRQKR